MEGLGITDGEIVRVVSARGEARLPAVGSERVLPRELFTSFHFPAGLTGCSPPVQTRVPSARNTKSPPYGWKRLRDDSIPKM